MTAGVVPRSSTAMASSTSRGTINISAARKISSRYSAPSMDFDHGYALVVVTWAIVRGTF